MQIDFLINECNEAVRTDSRFGICEDITTKIAYSTTTTPKKWIATVENPRQIELRFTPIDNCLIKLDELPGRGRCDGLLTSTEHLYFIELKDQRSKWISVAIKQIESTIELFKENHDISKFKHKKAFACNKKHPHFEYLNDEDNLQFFRKHNFRLDVQSTIKV